MTARAPKPRRLEYVPIDDLVPDARNPKAHDLDTLRASVRALGYLEPQIEDGRTGQLVAGHGRLELLLELRDAGDPAPEGIHVDGRRRWCAPVVRGWSSIDDDHAAAALVAQRAVERGGWNPDAVGAILDQLAPVTLSAGVDALDIIGPPSDWTDILPPVEPAAVDPEPLPDDDEPLPPPPPDPVTQVGDVWLLGEHRLACGDSFEEAHVDGLLQGTPVDLVLTDPPYAIYGSSSGIGSDIADDKMVRPFFTGLFRMLHPRVREFAHVYVHCDWRSYAAVWQGATGAKFTPKNCLVWDKGGFGLGANWPNAHEFILFVAKLPPPRAMTSNDRRGQRQVLTHANILRYDRPRGAERLHNAAKPVGLLSTIIEHASDEGAVVLDLFGGSGSTLIAAERTGRRARVSEFDPGTCDVICGRFQRLTGVAPIRESTGEPHDFAP